MCTNRCSCGVIIPLIILIIIITVIVPTLWGSPETLMVIGIGRISTSVSGASTSIIGGMEVICGPEGVCFLDPEVWKVHLWDLAYYPDPPWKFRNLHLSRFVDKPSIRIGCHESEVFSPFQGLQADLHFLPIEN